MKMSEEIVDQLKIMNILLLNIALGVADVEFNDEMVRLLTVVNNATISVVEKYEDL